MTDMAEPPESPRPTTLADTSITQPDAWHTLRRYTPARIALGRVGASLPTGEVLDFSMAHARARDAVHLPFDPETLASALKQAGFSTIEVRSLAANRSEYLRRPDLGRRLDPACGPLLRDDAAPIHRLTMIVGDGLSALAPARHALPLLLELQAQLAQIQTWSLDSIILANQARVALSDQIGQLRGAEAAVILLGERPGLSSPDSLGVYLTYAPRHGRSDAERNCLSNIRHEGLSYPEAAYKLLYLLEQARTAGASGVVIKDSSDWSAATSLPAQGSKQFSS